MKCLGLSLLLLCLASCAGPGPKTDLHRDVKTDAEVGLLTSPEQAVAADPEKELTGLQAVEKEEQDRDLQRTVTEI